MCGGGGGGRGRGQGWCLVPDGPMPPSAPPPLGAGCLQRVPGIGGIALHASMCSGKGTLHQTACGAVTGGYPPPASAVASRESWRTSCALRPFPPPAPGRPKGKQRAARLCSILRNQTGCRAAGLPGLGSGVVLVIITWCTSSCTLWRALSLPRTHAPW